jgi:hypothetical protein
MTVWNVATVTPSGDHNTEVRVEFLSPHNATPEVTLEAPQSNARDTIHES